jgi:hypothetical protein
LETDPTKANLLVQYKSLVTAGPNETLDYKDSSTVPPLRIGMTCQLPVPKERQGVEGGKEKQRRVEVLPAAIRPV